MDDKIQGTQPSAKSFIIYIAQRKQCLKLFMEHTSGLKPSTQNPAP